MNLEYRSDLQRFVFHCRYDERFTPKSMGFWWDGELKQWYTGVDKWYQADGLSKFADVTAREKLAQLKGLVADPSIEASYKIEPTIEVPAPKGLKYLKYQLCGIEYAYNHHNCLIADEPGLGKTIQAAGLINLIPEMRNILIIVPASLKLNWYQELSKWLVDDRLTIGVAHGKKLPRTNIVIINYDIVAKHLQNLKRDWDLIVCDESHYLKSGKTLRTKCITKLQAPRKLWLTGTPVMNKPEELWTSIRTLSPGLFSYTDFHEKMIYPFHYDTLQYELRKSFMIRRLKTDVLADLPPKTRSIIEVPAVKDIVEREEKAFQELVAAHPASGTVEFEKAVSNLQKVFGADWTKLSEIRIEAALAKLPYIIDFAKELIQSGNKVIIFAHHHKVLDAIKKAFPYNSVVLHGQVNIADRNTAVNAFQNDPRVTTFIGGIRAAGFGLTLTASHYVIFAELDFTPSVMTQCEDRVHRIGQKHPIFVYHFVLKGSFDSRMARILLDKQKMVDETVSTSENVAITPYRSRVEDDTASLSLDLEKPNVNDLLEISSNERSDFGICSPLRLPGL